jgi:hypothetical protein
MEIRDRYSWLTKREKMIKIHLGIE